MEEKDVQRLLDMLYSMIDEAKSAAFSSDKCVISRDEALDLLDDIRAKLPLEIKKAQELVRAREEYVSSAKKEVEKMLRQAELDAKVIVSESETLQQARRKSSEIIRRAEERSKELYHVANTYTEDALRRTEEAIQAALDEVKESRVRFRATSNEQMQANQEKLRERRSASEQPQSATCTAKHVANPGCFATCIQLGLLPLAKHLMLNGDIMVNAITGSTGAGVKPGATSHFSWRNNNLSVYKAFEHQHVPEIKQSLKQLQNSFDSDIDFIPYRGDFPRGIFTTIVIKTKVALEEIVRMYEEYYAKDSFTHIVGKNIDLKQVVNTNKCLIHLEKHGDKLLIISCIDNLLKGASGQAVHNMNLMFNLEETVGLRLKPSAF